MAERPTSITVFSIINLIILGISGIILLVGFFGLFAHFDIGQFIISLIFLGATALFIIGMIKALQQKKLGFILNIIYASLGILGCFISTIITLVGTVFVSSTTSALGRASSSAAAREFASGSSSIIASLGAIAIIFLIGFLVYYIFNLKVFIKHKNIFS